MIGTQEVSKMFIKMCHQVHDITYMMNNKKVKCMEQKYIKGDIVMYDNRIHTIMDTLELNNYKLSYIRHTVHQLELSGLPITFEILEKNGWKERK